MGRVLGKTEPATREPPAALLWPLLTTIMSVNGFPWSGRGAFFVVAVVVVVDPSRGCSCCGCTVRVHNIMNIVLYSYCCICRRRWSFYRTVNVIATVMLRINNSIIFIINRRTREQNIEKRSAHRKSESWKIKTFLVSFDCSNGHEVK